MAIGSMPTASWLIRGVRLTFSISSRARRWRSTQPVPMDACGRRTTWWLSEKKLLKGGRLPGRPSACRAVVGAALESTGFLDYAPSPAFGQWGSFLRRLPDGREIRNPKLETNPNSEFGNVQNG